MEELLSYVTESYNWIENNKEITALIGLVSSGLAGTGLFSFLRRLKPDEDTNKLGEYFTDRELLSPPLRRPAYSDRMAYVLAEMSELAYYEFEGDEGLFKDNVNQVKKLDTSSEINIRQFLEKFSLEVKGNRSLSTDFMGKLLNASGYELLQSFDIGTAQGFACKRTAENEPSYVVIAFRGTENKISDWLTDIDAIPKEFSKAKVHSGFYKAFNVEKKEGKTTSETIAEIINSPEAKDAEGNLLPLFITGHSLGGALALMATRTLAKNINGACYTFGAPRIANYAFFEKVKTPVYRVVNSADVVPRVPPGALLQVLIGTAKLLSWLTGFMPPVARLCDNLESLMDKLSGYRHFGDLRYLTDVASGRFSHVKLLRNPPSIDRILWFWKHLTISLKFPIKQHSMKIYRKKLKYIANDRAD
ncbi:MAG: triacylglycerol lipase [Gammaproteobacteria bacterium]|jgi:triacylglycerol lipase